MPGADDRVAFANGRFERGERLDAGGLGTVWRGVDRETDAPVAIKADHDEVNADEHVRAGFRQELRWFRELSAGPTPGSLVHYVDGAVGDAGCYVVTELLEGGALGDRVAGDDRFAGEASPGVDALRSVAPALCRAVDFLHRNGVVHRDVKPGNVLHRLRDPGASASGGEGAAGSRGGDAGATRTPVLIDLNSAVAVDDESDTLFHHDPYKPPELSPTDRRAEPVGPPADVYALGQLCCFLLAGEVRAFDADAVGDWHAVDPRDLGADCEADLARVVERATAPAPDDRHADAGALADALAAALGLPERTAVLVDEATGRRIRLRPGDALGRWTPDRRVPHATLRDPDRVLSPVHASLEWNGSDWVLVDRSLNGTYVDGSGGWEYALSGPGRERRTAEGASLPEADPPETVAVSAGDRIAPVDPEAGWVLRFEPG